MAEVRTSRSKELRGLRPQPADRRALQPLRLPGGDRGHRLRALQAAGRGGRLAAARGGRRQRTTSVAGGAAGAARAASCSAACGPASSAPPRASAASSTSGDVEPERCRRERALRGPSAIAPGAARRAHGAGASRRPTRINAPRGRCAPAPGPTWSRRSPPSTRARIAAPSPGLSKSLGRAAGDRDRDPHGQRRHRRPDHGRLGARLVPVGGRARERAAPRSARSPAARRSISCAPPIATGTSTSPATAPWPGGRSGARADRGAGVKLTVHVDGGARGNPGPGGDRRGRQPTPTARCSPRPRR